MRTRDSARGPVTAVLCGAGLRGRDVYGAYALRHPGRLRFVAVAEPNEARREHFRREHGIPEHKAFRGWRELMAEGRLARVAVVSTPDAVHYEPARRALELGYDLLLEKPISPDLGQCRALASFPLAQGQIAQVAHVLRFAPFWRKLKEVVASGRIGRIVHVDHSENVSTWHFGHSYVRGHYGVQASSSPMILAKACHDLDLIGWLVGEKALAVQSAGALAHYRPENAPAGAPERCTDGCPAEASCPWYAPRFYLRGEPVLRTVMHGGNPWLRALIGTALRAPALFRPLASMIRPLELLVNWNVSPVPAIGEDLSIEGKMRALREGPYGRCVYRCGNDAADHQVSAIRFPSGATAALTVHGLSEFEGRELRIFGSRGTLRGVFRIEEQLFTVTDLRRLRTETVYRHGLSTEGHCGGDRGLLEAFTSVLLGERSAAEAGLSGIGEVLESHFLAFAAEESRRRRAEVRLEELRRRA